MNVSSDLVDWLEESSLFPKFCWADPENTFAALGAGQIHTKLPKAFCYGGMRFDRASLPSVEWSPFGKAQFIEPLYVQRGEVANRECPISLSPLESKEHWAKCVEEAQSAPYEKIVVARRLIGACENPYALFRSFDREAGTPFLFAPTKDHCFLGVSPERLFHLDGSTVEVDAVAGTRPFIGESTLDEKMRRELFFSPKERYEHYLVVQHIEKILGFPPGDIGIREAGSVQHLLQEFVGETSLSAEELLRALHPTPAVAGAPPAVIRAIEGFDRGWYAGPIGVSDGSVETFAVAIRSGLWAKGSLTWFTGCGITAGSSADAEWEETARKAEVLSCVRT